MTRSLSGGLNPEPPVLEESTLTLGYQGGGVKPHNLYVRTGFHNQGFTLSVNLSNC